MEEGSGQDAGLRADFPAQNQVSQQLFHIHDLKNTHVVQGYLWSSEKLLRIKPAGRTHFLRLQTVGVVELLDDDLTLLQGGGSRRTGGAAVNPQRLQRGDEGPRHIVASALPCRSWTFVVPAGAAFQRQFTDKRLAAAVVRKNIL